MFQDKYPHFKRDSILKSEMLINLMEYPRDMFSLVYEDYSDGIITGVDVTVKDNEMADNAVVESTFDSDEDQIIVKSGIIKHQGKLYLMKEKQYIGYEATEKKMILKVVFDTPVITADFTTSRAKIVLSDEPVQGEDEMELCRFLLKAGAKLRQNYQDMDDFTTVHNTINRLYVPYAGIGGTTIAPEITYYFGEALMKSNVTNPYDIAFAMQCMQNKQIHRPLIMQYLKLRMGATENINNEQIHSYFASILAEVQKGRGSRSAGTRTGRRVIVD
ncbi:hypothetical protein [Anaerosporobacter sp.]|uniref:hypothetical protein n=1 Tax=Anaerosporobacter sp. TaxID=1872529 RepID=UPI00286F181F|nr:hypothetical protein [Anaerosporobacter sp.]